MSFKTNILLAIITTKMISEIHSQNLKGYSPQSREYIFEYRTVGYKEMDYYGAVRKVTELGKDGEEGGNSKPCCVLPFEFTWENLVFQI